MNALMKKIAILLLLTLIVPALLWSQAAQDKFDVLTKDGTLYDGSGEPPIQADVGIVAIGKPDTNHAGRVVDAKGLAVAPGFINGLSWSIVT